MSDDDAGDDDADNDLPPELATAPSSSKRAFKRATNQRKLEARDTQRFWIGIFSDPVGRREMWRLLSDCHAFEERFATTPAGNSCPERTDYWRGERDVGIRLHLACQAITFGGVHLMHLEHDPRFPGVDGKPKGGEP